MEWLGIFSEMAAADQKSLLGRYRLMDVLLRKLNEVRASIDATLTARSPLEKYEDAEVELRDKWEDELKAAIEAEYRRQRSDFLLALQWWLRDVWVQALGKVQGLKSKVQSPESEVEAGAAESQSINHQLSTIHSPLGAIHSLEGLLVFPQMAGTRRVAERISPKAAMENLRIIEQLQRWLHTNVQEALALEVGLLKLHL
jgi:hypothetical protein